MQLEFVGLRTPPFSGSRFTNGFNDPKENKKYTPSYMKMVVEKEKIDLGPAIDPLPTQGEFCTL